MCLHGFDYLTSFEHSFLIVSSLDITVHVDPYQDAFHHLTACPVGYVCCQQQVNVSSQSLLANTVKFFIISCWVNHVNKRACEMDIQSLAVSV